LNSIKIYLFLVIWCVWHDTTTGGNDTQRWAQQSAQASGHFRSYTAEQADLQAAAAALNNDPISPSSDNDSEPPQQQQQQPQQRQHEKKRDIDDQWLVLIPFDIHMASHDMTFFGCDQMNRLEKSKEQRARRAQRKDAAKKKSDDEFLWVTLHVHSFIHSFIHSPLSYSFVHFVNYG
jgi:hypothetical protein